MLLTFMGVGVKFIFIYIASLTRNLERAQAHKAYSRMLKEFNTKCNSVNVPSDSDEDDEGQGSSRGDSSNLKKKERSQTRRYRSYMTYGLKLK